MPTVIDLGSWGFWAVVLVIVLFIMWLIWGRQTNLEVVGLQPLYAPTNQDRYPVPELPRQAPLPPHNYTAPIPQVQPPRPLENPPPREPIVFTPIPRTQIPPATVDLPPTPPRHFRSIGEELTCRAFETLLRRRVEVNRSYGHLVNPQTGHLMTYDMYDPVSRIAVEYNGQQHYEFCKRFHRSMEDFYEQVYRDNVKLVASENEGIRLIRVAYYVDVCDPDARTVTGYRYNSRITREQRYHRIYAFLERSLETLGVLAPLPPLAPLPVCITPREAEEQE